MQRARYVYAVGRACDAGRCTRQDAAAAILFAAERATQVALEAIQSLGGNGYINDYPAGRLLRDAKLYEIGAGTQEIRRMLIGRELFRDDRLNLQFEPIAVEPTYRKVASALVEHIVAGRLQAGDHLPPELELARQFGVNRSTVREALRELDSAGLLGRRRGSKRMMVMRPGTSHVGAGVRRALVLHDVTFLDVWEALMILEPPLAATAATRRMPATANHWRRRRAKRDAPPRFSAKRWCMWRSSSARWARPAEIRHWYWPRNR